jgi:hypothetical protein
MSIAHPASAEPPAQLQPLPAWLSQLLAAAYRELSDEQFGMEFWNSWCAYKLQGLQVRVDGVPLDPVPPAFFEEFLPDFVEAIRIEAFKEDTDNEGLMGLKEALRLCASRNYAAAGRLVRQHFSRRITLLSALNELATGHHRQSATARNARPDYLQRCLTEIDDQKPDVTPLEAKEELKRRVGAPGEEPRIHCVDEDAGEVQWYEKGRPEQQSAPLSALKDRLYNVRKARRREKN